jgi:hypothetical protein
VGGLVTSCLNGAQGRDFASFAEHPNQTERIDDALAAVWNLAKMDLETLIFA